MSHMTQHAASVLLNHREALISADASFNWFENKSVPCISRDYEEWFCIAVYKDKAFVLYLWEFQLAVPRSKMVAE